MENKINIRDILITKAFINIRLIAMESSNSDIILYEKGDELGIEAIDFSAGFLRVCNKSEIRSFIFEIQYDKISGYLNGEYIFDDRSSGFNPLVELANNQ